MKIAIAGSPQRPAREFQFQLGSSIGDRATFDDKGKANTHFHFVSYNLSVTKGEERTLFRSSAPDPSNRLLAVHDRFVDMKFPLQAFRVTGAGRPRIEIRDA